MDMTRTAIPVDPRVRDRLRNYGARDEDYTAILTRLMDEVELERYVAEQRRNGAERFASLEET